MFWRSERSSQVGGVVLKLKRCGRISECQQTREGGQQSTIHLRRFCLEDNYITHMSLPLIVHTNPRTLPKYGFL